MIPSCVCQHVNINSRAAIIALEEGLAQTTPV